MNLQGRNLLLNLQGADVALLHTELTQLGFSILAAEITAQLFGSSTQHAVMSFQQQHHLPMTGVVDAPTAAQINIDVAKSAPTRASTPIITPHLPPIQPGIPPAATPQPATPVSTTPLPETPPIVIPPITLPPVAEPPPTVFIVRGHVRWADGKPLADAMVRAVDRDLREEEILDEVPIGRDGRYEIHYTASQFTRNEKDRADLVVRAIGSAGAIVASSSILFNAPPIAIIDLVVSNEAFRGPSEFDQLVAELTPLLPERVSLVDLTEDDRHQDITFLAAETGKAPQHIAFLIKAHQFETKTELPAEAFYAWFRENLPTDLPSLSGQGVTTLRTALEKAIAANIIAADFSKQVESVIARLHPSRIEQPAFLVRPEILFDNPRGLAALDATQKAHVAMRLNEHLRAEVLKAIGPVSAAMSRAVQAAALRLDYQTFETADVAAVVTKGILALVKKDPRLAEEAVGIETRFGAEPSSKVADLLSLDVPLRDNPIFWSDIRRLTTLEYARQAQLGEAATNLLCDKALSLAAIDESALAELVQEGAITDQQKNALQLTLDLGKLTGDHFSFIDVLKKLNPKSPVDLIGWEQADWQRVISENRLTLPPGETVETYADTIVFNMERTYPTQILFNRLLRPQQTVQVGLLDSLNPLFGTQDHLITGTDPASIDWSAHPENLQANLENLTAFANTYRHLGVTDLINDKAMELNQKKIAINTRLQLLDTFHKDNPDTDLRLIDFFAETDGIDWSHIPSADRPQVRKQVMAYQRVLTLADSTSDRQKLLSKGYDSAFAVADQTETEFQRSTGLDGIGARVAYARGKHLAMKSAHHQFSILDTIKGGFQNFRIHNIDPTLINDLRSIDGFDDLFGSQNFCECESCRSILSPAAYFVDLMFYIEKNVSKPVFVSENANSSLYLKNRRSDLWQLPLTCENTDTLVPYLTIVNEVLETYLDKVLAPDEVYKSLSDSNNRISFNSPFNLPFEELRLYLSHFGLTLSDICRTLGEPDAKIWRARLNLSPEEFKVIVDSKPAVVLSRYGNPALLAKFPVNDYINKNKGIDRRGFIGFVGITRAQLDELLNLKFNPGLSNITVDQLDVPEELQNFPEVLNGLTNERLDFIHRFIRLWRKTGWSISELDLVLNALNTLKAANLATPVLDDDTVNNLARLIDIQQKLNYKVEELCSLVDQLPVSETYPLPPAKQADRRLFERLFDLKKLFEEDPITHKMNDSTKFYHYSLDTSNPPDKKIDPKTPALLSGLGISETDFLGLCDLLKEEIPFGADGYCTLYRKQISLLYRHARLAKALKFSIEDFIQVLRLNFAANQQVVSTLDQIEQLKAFRDWLKSSPFTVSELLLILTGEESNAMKYRSTADTAGTLVQQVQIAVTQYKLDALKKSLSSMFATDHLDDALQQIHADFNSPGIRIALNASFTNGVPDKLSDLNALIDLVSQIAQVLSFTPATPTVAQMVESIQASLPDAQQSALKTALAQSFNLTFDLLNHTMLWVDNDLSSNGIKTSLNAAFTNDVPNSVDDLNALLGLLHQIERVLAVFGNLKFKENSVAYLTDPAHTSALGIVNLKHLTLDDLKALTFYRRLSGLNEGAESIVQLVLGHVLSMADADSLADLWKQDKTLIVSLIDALKLIPPPTLPLTPTQKNPIVTLQYIWECLIVCQTLGINGYSLQKLADDQDFTALGEASAIALGAFSSRYDDETVRQDKLETYQDQLNVIKRDALCDYIIARQSDLHFKDLHDLYAFFLLDVEMGGCFRTSRLVCAISSLQLYVHRILVDLEQSASGGINVLADMVSKSEPGKADQFRQEWEWRKNYRVWEANRKVFLYPENYLEPDLRDNKTPIFKELEDELLQEKINKDSAKAAYKKYVSQFAELARLKIAGSYYYKEDNTYYFFAYTTQDPPQYYYRQWKNMTVWSPWEKIDLAINAERVSAVIHLGKLYIFWIDIKSKGNTEIKNGTQNAIGHTYNYTLHYSNLNEHHKWIPAQKIDLIKDRDIEDGIFDQHRYFSDCVFARADVGSEGKINIFYFDRYLANKPVKTSVPMDQGFAANLNDQGIDIKKTIDKAYQLYQTHLDSGATITISQPDPDGWFTIDVIWTETTAASVPQKMEAILTAELDLFKNDLIRPSQLTPATKPLIDSGTKLMCIDEDYFYGIGVRITQKPLHEAQVDYGVQPYFADKFPVLDADTSSTAPVTSGQIFDPDPYLFVVSNKPGEFVLKLGNQQYLIYQSAMFFSNKLSYRISTSLTDDLGGILFSQGLEKFLAYETQRDHKEKAVGVDFIKPLELMEPFDNPDHIDFRGAYGEYYRELFFHIPFLIANALNAEQKFEEAKWWYGRVFDPTNTEKPDPEKPGQRNWRYIEFRGLSIQKMKDILSDKATTDQYERDPFNPHAIARIRPNAYQKTIVMKYIDNLLDWGDDLFAQDSIESINEATMLYVLAADLLGKRPVKLGKCKMTNEESLSFGTISQKNGSEFLIALENFNWSNSISAQLSRLNAGATSNLGSARNIASEVLSATEGNVPLALAGNQAVRVTIKPIQSLMSYGQASLEKNQINAGVDQLSISAAAYYPIHLAQQSTLAFCVPPNADLLAYWDRVEDRLFKIRHCMNISGVRRQLALFQPPIDPMALVRARAAGLSLEDILSTMAAPLPPYRFSYLIEKAKQFAQTTQSFGSALLSALEKKDGEELTLLRSVHERNILNMTREIKQKQLMEAQNQYQAVVETKTNVQNRIDYYQGLMIANPDDLGLNSWELSEVANRNLASDLKMKENALYIAAAIAHLMPEAGSPFAMTFGGKQMGPSGRAIAEAMASAAAYLESRAVTAGLEASFQRRWEEWTHQLILAQQELKQVEQQRLAADIRQQIATNDLALHEKNVGNAAELDAFYKDKFTSLGLYTYLSTTLNRLFREAYNVAHDLAKMAERTYQFERDDDTVFIAGDNWQFDWAGLLAGERLLLQLQRMEKSYLQQHKRDLEVTQSFSLALLNPRELLDLRETGSCDFDIPEIVLDLAYPGQYKRIIKSARLTIPCVAGPYTNVSAKLTLTNSSVRQVPATDSVLSELSTQKFTSIATSNAQNDGGLFELSFRDERYLPFEGAGAVSKWKLELPSQFRLFDYDTISDVILHISYTAKEDGVFKQAVETDIAERLTGIANDFGLSRLLSLKHEFPAAFHRLLNPTADTAQSTSFDVTQSYFPYFLTGKELAIDGNVTVLLKPKGTKAIDTTGLVVNINGKSGDIREPLAGIDPAEITNLSQADVLISGNPIGLWTIDVAPANFLTSDEIDDILILLHYTAT